jgi:hypothetical protein
VTLLLPWQQNLRTQTLPSVLRYCHVGQIQKRIFVYTQHRLFFNPLTGWAGHRAPTADTESPESMAGQPSGSQALRLHPVDASSGGANQGQLGAPRCAPTWRAPPLPAIAAERPPRRSTAAYLVLLDVLRLVGLLDGLQRCCQQLGELACVQPLQASLRLRNLQPDCMHQRNGRHSRKKRAALSCKTAAASAPLRPPSATKAP